MSMIELLLQNIFPMLVIGFFLLLAGIVILPAFFGAPWHPLSNATIRHILEFAEVAPGDKVYDLGSGDGRILISAAKDYGAEAVGVEIDPVKVWTFPVACANGGSCRQGADCAWQCLRISIAVQRTYYFCISPIKC